MFGEFCLYSDTVLLVLCTVLLLLCIINSPARQPCYAEHVLFSDAFVYVCISRHLCPSLRKKAEKLLYILEIDAAW